jgi:zinc transport system ATP-binding protein
MAEYALQIENLAVEFLNHPVFRNLTLKLPAGEFLAIIGPNGAGKSCLVKVILGLLKPGAGTVRVKDKTPADVPADWIGYVPQVKTIDRSFPGRAIELVVTGLCKSWPWRISQDHKAKAKAALERVGAGHLAERPIGKLSGGELQRVFLARCLVRKPKLIVLDEPATGIDVTLVTDMYGLLEEIRQEMGATIVMVTHDLAAASYHADKVLLINQEAICYGTPAECLTDEHLRRTFGHTGHAHLMLTGGERHA